MTAIKRKPSRYPKPGTLSSGWWEDADNGYRLMQTWVAVMATSRHKRRIDDDAAFALLSDRYGDELKGMRVAFWRSVTQYDVECNAVGDSGAGDWNEQGTGSAWVKVAYPMLRDDGSSGGPA